jgi:hypothetical protein
MTTPPSRSPISAPRHPDAAPLVILLASPMLSLTTDINRGDGLLMS